MQGVLERILDPAGDGKAGLQDQEQPAPWARYQVTHFHLKGREAGWLNSISRLIKTFYRVKARSKRVVTVADGVFLDRADAPKIERD